MDSRLHQQMIEIRQRVEAEVAAHNGAARGPAQGQPAPAGTVGLDPQFVAQVARKLGITPAEAARMLGA